MKAKSKNASKRSKTSGLTRRSPIIFRSCLMRKQLVLTATHSVPGLFKLKVTFELFDSESAGSGGEGMGMSFDEELLIKKVVERPWEATIAQAIRVMEGADIEALGFKCKIGEREI